MPSKGTVWPHGNVSSFHEDLASHLWSTAAQHACSALDKFTSDDDYDCLLAAINVGCAVELMAKSYLTSIEPALLADRADRDTLLYLTDNGHKTRSSATEITTRSSLDALTIVKHFAPSLRFNPKSKDNLVFRVRNSSVHMGLLDGKELRVAVIVMVRVLEDIRGMSDRSDKNRFWGTSRIELVDSLLDEASSEIRNIVVAKIAAARAHLARMLKHLSEDGQRLVLASLSGRPARWSSDHDEPQRCPVCQQQGWLVCSIDRGMLQYEEDTDTAWVDRTAWPVLFECPVCLLILEDEESADFNFPEEIELEPDYDPYENSEPRE